MTTIEPAIYTYVTTDLLSNRVLSEIPFTGVSFERYLNKAGSFSGSIPMINTTEDLDIYNATKPGKTGLYILRKVSNDNTCVWGGIIWSRNYNAIDRTLQISASEFPSYFYHRLIWKTLTYGSEPLVGYSISYAVVNKIGTITFGSEHGYVPGDNVKIENISATINGYYTVATATPISFTFVTSAANTSGVTIAGQVKKVTDKYTLVRDLIRRVIVEDLSGLPFPDDTLKPSKVEEVGISHFKRETSGASKIITIKTEAPHGLTVGQEIELETVPTNSYSVSNKQIVNKTAYISKVSITAGVAVCTTVSAHTFLVDDSVTISKINNPNTLLNEIFSQMNQSFTITAKTSTTFTVNFADATLNTPVINSTTYPSLSAFLAANITGSGAKDSYIVDNQLYVWDVANSSWVTYGVITPEEIVAKDVETLISVIYGLVELSTSIATLTTTTNHTFTTGEKTYISGVGEPFDGLHIVLDAPTSNTFRYNLIGSAQISSTAVSPVGSAVDTDFDGYHIVTSIPKFSVIYVNLSSNVATITTTTAHSFAVGEQIFVSGIDSTFNGTYTIASTPTPTTLTYAKTADNSSTQELDPLGTVVGSRFTFIDDTNLSDVGYASTGGIISRMITNLAFEYPYVTVTTSSAHGLVPGVKIKLNNVPDAFFLGDNEGRFTVAIAPNSTTFKYTLNNINVLQPQINLPVTGNVFVTYGSRLFKATYGPYTANTDALQLDFDSTLSGTYQDYIVFKGDEDKTLGQRIDEIAETTNGFEYRIDCSYDIDTASFTRTLVFVKNTFANAPANGVVSDPSRFGADRQVFEFPGNIIEFNIDETADQASTRFFQSGKDQELSQEGLQPRSVAAADDLLDMGWPLLDSIDADDATTKDILYAKAQKNLFEDRPPIGEFSVAVNGSLDPTIGSYSPGDWCSLIIDDSFVRLRLASDDEIRKDIFVRKIAGYKVSVPDSPSFPEKVTLELLTEWEADNRGNNKTSS
jgi:hypothetical protein